MDNDLIYEIFKNLLKKDTPLISLLANTTSILKQIKNTSWAGFYFVDGDELILGPFQGSIACTKIERGKGVCGTSFLRCETIIVNDVELFPGHIACSASSKSEIVTPVIKEGRVVAVIDLDSDDLANFDLNTKKLLEDIARDLSEFF